MSEALLIVMNLHRIISVTAAALSFVASFISCFSVQLHLYCFGSLTTLGEMLWLQQAAVLSQKKALKATVHYLLSTKQRTGTFGNLLASIAEPSEAYLIDTELKESEY